MKKLFSAAIVSLFILGSAFSAPKPPVLEPITIDTIYETGEYTDFTVDPRFEITAIACRLAEMTGFTGTYNSGDEVIPQIVTLYEKYKNHKVVATIKSLIKKGISCDAMISLVYHIKPDFSGTLLDFSPLPETLHYEWKKIPVKTIYTLVTQLHDFAVESNFQRIYTLNRGNYLTDVGNSKRNFEETNLAEWAVDFFKDDEIQHPTITVSRLCVGYNFYDSSTSPEGKRLSYLTTYPGSYLDSIEICYIDFYAQLYASRNWPIVKDNFTKYIKDYRKKNNPDKKPQEIDKQEITDYDFTVIISLYFYLAFIKQMEPENHLSYDELFGAIEKQIGDTNISKIPAVIDEYMENRDKYPAFKDFAPRLNDFINSFTLSE